MTKEPNHSHIKSARLTGGTLDGKTLNFSPGLNCFIGVRGGGKSSILEAIRYAIGMQPGEKASDWRYKQDLVKFTLGSGGKAEIDVTDLKGEPYTIQRIWNQKESDVLSRGIPVPGCNIKESLLLHPIYFGQKDLSISGEGFERDLIDKLIGSKLDKITEEIRQQKIAVHNAAENLIDINSIQDQLDEQKKIKQNCEHQLKFYAEHGVEEKLQKRVEFDKDIRAMENYVRKAKSFLVDLKTLFFKHNSLLEDESDYRSKDIENDKIFVNFFSWYNPYVHFMDETQAWIENKENQEGGMFEFVEKLCARQKSMFEEFAEIERELAENLKERGTQGVSTEDFLNLKEQLDKATQSIKELREQDSQKRDLEDILEIELSELNELYAKEFNLIRDELNIIGLSSDSLSIVAEYKGDKEQFLVDMKEAFKGCGLRETTYQGIVGKYQDFAAIYRDFKIAQKLFGSNPATLTDLFMKKLPDLLSHQTPNKFTIMYRGKDLKQNSLGQRASALLLFILSQKNNDLIIIDQPEDDLDNQTIYEDVIKLILEMKPSTQFIFATHNPNIPVLGDADQIHVCSFENGEVVVHSGGIGDPVIQNAIVDIMEGGQKALDLRNGVYQSWINDENAF